MSTEDRLRQALQAHTDTVHPSGSYREVRERTAAARRVRRFRTTALAGLAAAAAIAVVVAAVAVVGGDDGQRVDVGPAGPAGPGTSAPGSSTTTSVTGTAVPTTTPIEVLFVSELDGPEAAARDFAVGYLGMRDPTVGEFQQGGPNDGEVRVQATDPGAVTIVGVRQIADGRWGVVFAASENIRAATPGPLDVIRSPVRVTGEARAFEGTVQVEVRQDGQRAGESLGAGFVTGSGDEILRHFEGDIEFAAPTREAGAVVFYTESAEDGSVWEATVVRIVFG